MKNQFQTSQTNINCVFVDNRLVSNLNHNNCITEDYGAQGGKIEDHLQQQNAPVKGMHEHHSKKHFYAATRVDTNQEVIREQFGNEKQAFPLGCHIPFISCITRLLSNYIFV